jgi:8-oxo-dGTP pyrophosphatase MutT (NUDIX family)
MNVAGDYLQDDLPLRPGDAVAAVILAPDGRYILQLRDRKVGIFFPDHWGLFGGAIEESDASLEESLRRELQEEIALDLSVNRLAFFTNFTFDMKFCGRGILFRTFFEVKLSQSEVAALVLGEGSAFRAFTALEALSTLRLVPYDSFALWMHANGRRMIPRAGEPAQ